MNHMSRLLSLSVLLLGTIAPAELVINFDDGENPFSAGTLSRTVAFSGNTSLRIDGGDLAVFTLPEHLATAANTHTIRVTMRVFDSGLWVNPDVEGNPGAIRRGPRWGVSTGDGGNSQYFGANITHFPPHVLSKAAYGHNFGNNDGRFEPWWTQLFNSPRNVEEFGDGGSVERGSWVPSTEGEGAWSLWIFTLAPDGAATIQREGGRLREGTIEAGGIRDIFLAIPHREDAERLGTIFVDDITIEIVR